jgi:antitoxin component of MazEF toxin-antitoxin module
MSLKDKGKVQKYGNTLFLPIPKSIRCDTIYSKVGIDKGDTVEVSIDGSTLRFRKLI